MFTGAEVIRNCHVRAPRESKLGKHKNVGALVFWCSGEQSVPGSKVFLGAKCSEEQSVPGSKVFWGVKCSDK